VSWSQASKNDTCSRLTILGMLIKLNIEIGMTLIFIMVRGKFVESGSPDYVILHPQQPYT
jgi:ABC-type oligopeptide transport system ATPase subunit